MNNDGLISDSNVEDFKETKDFFCKACQYGKQRRLHFKSSSREKSKSGELIHSDICGKMSQSKEDASYFICFKDDCTAYRMIYFIKHKFDVFEKIKEYVNLVEHKFERHVKTLQIDNVREYCNKQMH